MQCPRCQVPLAPDSYDAAAAASPYRARLSAAFDRLRCAECRGSWVASHDVAQLVLDVAEPMVGRAHAETIARAFAVDTEDMDVADSVKVPCPRCAKPMDKQRSRVRFLVLYDRCASCRGMWFDDGELARIIDALDARIAEARPAE